MSVSVSGCMCIYKYVCVCVCKNSTGAGESEDSIVECSDSKGGENGEHIREGNIYCQR